MSYPCDLCPSWICRVKYCIVMLYLLASTCAYVAWCDFLTLINRLIEIQIQLVIACQYKFESCQGQEFYQHIIAIDSNLVYVVVANIKYVDTENYRIYRYKHSLQKAILKGCTDTSQIPPPTIVLCGVLFIGYTIGELAMS